MRAGRSRTGPAQRRRWRVLAAIAVAVVMTVAWAADATLAPAQGASPQHAGMAELFKSYNRITGRIGNSWWQSAVALSTLETYEQATGDRSYEIAIPVSFVYYAHTHFENAYNDDTGWWGLAWLQAYELTSSRLPQASRYLAMAETGADYIHKSWDGRCGGGVWWTTARTYKNAITNEVFLELTAWLHNIIPGDTKYLRWAQAEWAWFKSSGMINGSALVNDGLDARCANNRYTTWTYNQGVILAGLARLYQATGNTGELREAAAIARAAITHLTVGGILHEPCAGSGCGPNPSDVQSFKGIFTRDLKVLAVAARTSQFNSFFKSQARSVRDRDTRSDRQFGFLWRGPIVGLTPYSQASALDAIVAALDLPLLACGPRGSAVGGFGQRGEHGRENCVGPGGQLFVGQQLDWMGDIDHAGVWHAETACLLDSFVSERCRGDSDRRDAPALQVDEVMQTARRARASISEGLNDEVGIADDLVDQR
jgi:predicted alpha-1,6-mannanase (GH76 family)